MGISRAYIDSYYFLEIVLELKEKEDARRLLDVLSKDKFVAIVPQVVVGEAVSVLLRLDTTRDVVGSLVRTVKKYINVKECLAPAGKNSFGIMSEVQKREPRLDGTDVMILSQALGDPLSKFFFTPDKHMLNNLTITTYEKELRDEGAREEKLKIIDRI